MGGSDLRRSFALLLAVAVLLTSVVPGALARGPARMTTDIDLGGLVNASATGDPDTQVAPRLAVEDVNAFFAEQDWPLSVRLTVEGTGLDPEAAQAAAIARVIRDDGKLAIVPIWRADIWGDGVSPIVRQRFADLGGTVAPGVRFDPDAADFRVTCRASHAGPRGGP